VDENIPNITVSELRISGHDVLDIRGPPRQGMFDSDLWVLAQSEQRLLVTTDKSFAKERHVSHFGILIVRLHQPNERRIHARVMHAFRQFTAVDWRGLLVVTRDQVQSVSRWREEGSANGKLSLPCSWR